MGRRKIFAFCERLANNGRIRQNFAMKGAWKRRLADAGYAVLRRVFAAGQVDAVTHELASAFANDDSGSTLRSADGSIYGARNLLQLWPAVVNAWRQAPLPEILTDVLGPEFGLVRVLYFDKPPEQSWALPWWSK
jgi:hypothetical protein